MPSQFRREIAYNTRRLLESFRREHLRCIHGRRQQADEIANRAGRGFVALDGTGQGILGPRALGFGMAPEREQAHEARRHGDREDGQERRERRPAPAPATGVFELRDRTRLDREPIEPALEVVRERAGRGVSPPWVLPQASQSDRFEVARQAGDQRPGRRGLAGSHQIERLDHRRGLERRTSGQEAVQGGPEGEHVGSRTDRGAVAGNLFRSHERGGTPHSDRTGRRRAGSSPARAMPKSAIIGVT